MGVDTTMADDSRILAGHRPLIDDPLGPHCFEAHGERLFRFESPSHEPRAEVLLIHGLTEHPGRHFATARRLAERGYGVTLFELAGHGGSQLPVEQSEKIYRTYALSEDAATIRRSIAPSNGISEFFTSQYAALRSLRIRRHQEQIARVVEHVLPNLSGQPETPLFLIGSSMGGLLTADAALATPQMRSEGTLQLRGTVLLGPAFRPQGQPANRIQNAVIGEAWAERRFPIAPLRFVVKNALRFNLRLDTSWGAPYMSDQAEEVELYRDDPLIFKAMPSAYASSIESLMAQVDGKAERYPVDCLFFFPGFDGITSLAGGLQFAHRVREERGDRRCQIIQYEGIAAHDLTRSSVREQVLATILEWLDERNDPPESHA
ncbi:MAG: alpha/beta fold hydrolase [Acidobacteriota bacterium]